MKSSYIGLVAGLGVAIVLVYLLIVVNFQSWLDPFIIISALPAALTGIVLFLFLTRTHLSVPALMGSIMCMGVATANSILVVAFAKERLEHHGDALQAAIEAGFTRFRPVHHDGACDDHRYGADGPGNGRRRRTERAPRPRRNRRPAAARPWRLCCSFPSVFSLIHNFMKKSGARPAARESYYPAHQ